ncbi:sugar-binding transcriptional regulator [Flaviflexus equikiangi]|uniref:sugar-binding transcriptional regulator n=1 Tax=Flaviflexus equikiangi TaxID=2758573 RepID=UPI0015F6B5AB|nr:sugar-binding domain-containing protein [Flaviflexus equikiangi]
MKTGSAEHEHAMVRAAELYYNDGLLQSEVADKLRMSRWKVGRLLEEARASGLVEIKIHHPRSRRRDLERKLVARYDCSEAVVIESQPTNAATMELAAQAAADYLMELRPQPSIIGVSWGHTVAAIADRIPEGGLREPTIVQLNGGANSLRDTVDAGSIIRTIASKSRDPRTALLPSSAVVHDRELARHLLADRQVAGTINLAAKADVAVYSIGVLSPQSVLVKTDCITADELVRLNKSGAIGDILGHFIDRSGRVVDIELDQRTIGLDLDRLAAIPTSIAVSVGAEKSGITKAALYAGLCTVLVTESKIAEQVLGNSLE